MIKVIKDFELKFLTNMLFSGLLKNGMLRKRICILMVFFCFAEVAFSTHVHVNTVSSLQTAVNRALPGDTIIVANGIYTTSKNIDIACKATSSFPIVIAAETLGGAEIKGLGGFIISNPATYIVIKGFKFTHNTGITSIGPGATHCKITRNIFECAAVNSGDKSYLTVYGDDNEISYNLFQNKTDEGKMLSIQGPGNNKMAKRTWIHHNYFYNFPHTANNCSAIQIGLSSRSMDSAFCIVEYNLFIKTAGENEGCICHKSSNNIIRFNTFGAGSEEVSLRHGNKSQVYGNFFMGNTGLRFSGDDHKIFSNFFEGCSNAIICSNGDGEVADGSKLTCHDRPDRVQIVFNTLVDCKTNFKEPARTNGLGANDITFANNIIQGGEAVSILGDYRSPVWAGNILWKVTGGSIPSAGYAIADPKLVADKNNIYHIQSGSPAISAGVGIYSYVTIDMDGQIRGPRFDAGADQLSLIPATNRPLTTEDVGPNAGMQSAHSKNIESMDESKSKWAYPDAFGHLCYRKMERGDQIMDFSFAGYKGGGVKIPSVPVKVTVQSPKGDAAAVIQKAIDAVSKMEIVDGFRGAILLGPGIFNCERAINIRTSGVVLMGSGSGENGTILQMKGAPHSCIEIKGAVSSHLTSKPVLISDDYVPSGSTSFHISDSKIFALGDTILIRRPVTKEWTRFMGMDSLVRNGKNQTWLNGETVAERIIEKIEGDKIFVNIPLSDSYDSKYLKSSGVSVVSVSTTGEISDVGVENLRIVSPPQSVSIDQGHYRAIILNGTTDAWIRNINIFNTVNSVGIGGQRVTVNNVQIFHSVATLGSAKPADFSGNGSQILFDRCSVSGDNLFFFVTGARVTGPNVLLNCSFHGNGWIQPHARWATGLLVDGCRVPEGGIDFMNRGEMGSGHGWTIGWAVAWNCKAKSMTIQNPPGALNWAIGCSGERLKQAVPFAKTPLLLEGMFDSHGTPVTPSSLYLTQLSERLGTAALENIGYSSNDAGLCFKIPD